MVHEICRPKSSGQRTENWGAYSSDGKLLAFHRSRTVLAAYYDDAEICKIKEKV
jgi:hypothetical protein